MLIGDYVVVIEDPAGTILAEHTMTAGTGHPLVGHELKLLDGLTYVVDRVLHVSDANELSSRAYTHARVFVSKKTAVVGSGSGLDRLAPSREVLPFANPGPAADSAILPPSLIAVLVACGYRAQATQFKSRRRLAGRLYREGYGWFVEPESPTELWRLSRLAKRRSGEAQSLISAIAGGVVGTVIADDVSPLSEPPRSPSPRPRAGRRALRLV